MVTIHLTNNTRGTVEGRFDDAALDEHLAFRKSEFWWKSKFAKSGRWDGKTHLYHRASGSFPVGLLLDIKKWMRENEVAYEVIDERPAPDSVPLRHIPKLGGGITLRKDQKRAIRKAVKRKRGIIKGVTGCGKCLSPGTKVLLHSGKKVRADEVQAGYKLLGPDGQPRTVLSVSSGIDIMYEVRANRGDAKFSCNSIHVLTVYDHKSGSSTPTTG